MSRRDAWLRLLRAITEQGMPEPDRVVIRERSGAISSVSVEYDYQPGADRLADARRAAEILGLKSLRMTEVNTGRMHTWSEFDADRWLWHVTSYPPPPDRLARSVRPELSARSRAALMRNRRALGGIQ